MNFEEVISKLAGDRAIKRSANIQKDFRGQVSVEGLIENKKLFLNDKRILEEYQQYEEDYDIHRMLLYVFLTKENYMINDNIDAIINEVKVFRKYLLSKEKYMNFNQKEKEIYEIVLETILTDKKISPDEMNVLERLQKKLNINIFQHWLIRIKNNLFEEVNNIDQQSNDKILGYLRDLEKKGLLFNIEAEDGKFYIIPEELADKLEYIYGVELQDYKFEELLDHSVITNKDKLRFLKTVGIEIRGDSKKIDATIIANRLRPSDFLESLSKKSLHRIANKTGIQTSGSKKVKIKRILKHYDERYIPAKKITDQREFFYKFYDELAERNQSELFNKGIIEKGEEIGTKFEEATKYLFEKVLGFTLQSPVIKGRKFSVKADGKAVKDNDYIIWDCKTKDKYFEMNTGERRQFIDYINEYKKSDPNNFISFLIITPEIKDKDDLGKQLTEIKAETGIDISIIKANDLKRFAEKIRKHEVVLDLKKVFYNTRILDYDYLDCLCIS